MTATEVAVEIRAAIKAAKKSGELPTGCTVSVRSGYTSQMQEVRVTITSVGDGDLCDVSERLCRLVAPWREKWANLRGRYLDVYGTCRIHRTHQWL